MKREDIIYAIICGLAVAWIVADFVPMKYGTPYRMIGFAVLPILSVVGLLLCDIIGRKYLFVHQAGKFALAGAFADVIDIKVFQFLFLILPFSLAIKAFSFLVATLIKYLTNKHWTFAKHEKASQSREVVQFFTVAIIGLFINVVSFYCATQIIGPQFKIPAELWTELSIIFSALVVATWNFLGYKFIVFKK
jgi:putative flippase GtrA